MTQMLLYRQIINGTGVALMAWLCLICPEPCPCSLLLLLSHLCINIFTLKPRVLLHASALTIASPTLSHA